MARSGRGLRPMPVTLGPQTGTLGVVRSGAFGNGDEASRAKRSFCACWSAPISMLRSCGIGSSTSARVERVQASQPQDRLCCTLDGQTVVAYGDGQCVTRAPTSNELILRENSHYPIIETLGAAFPTLLLSPTIGQRGRRQNAEFGTDGHESTSRSRETPQPSSVNSARTFSFCASMKWSAPATVMPTPSTSPTSIAPHPLPVLRPGGPGPSRRPEPRTTTRTRRSAPKPNRAISGVDMVIAFVGGLCSGIPASGYGIGGLCQSPWRRGRFSVTGSKLHRHWQPSHDAHRPGWLLSRSASWRHKWTKPISDRLWQKW